MIATFCVPTTGAATVDPPTLSTAASELAGSVSIVVRLPGHRLNIQESYHLQNLRIPCVFERFLRPPPILCGQCDNLGVIGPIRLDEPSALLDANAQFEGGCPTKMPG